MVKKLKNPSKNQSSMACVREKEKKGGWEARIREGGSVDEREEQKSSSSSSSSSSKLHH